ncbi:MAG: response regulator, partial [Rickettsiales bacterium]
MVVAKKILLVDDDEALRAALRDQLVLHEDFSIQEVANGAEAIREAKNSPFALFIIDVGLPDMDGREVCKLL